MYRHTGIVNIFTLRMNDICCVAKLIHFSRNTAKTIYRIERMAKNLPMINVETISWKSIKEEGLDLDYSVAIPEAVATTLYQELESIVEYFTGDLAKIKYDVIYQIIHKETHG